MIYGKLSIIAVLVLAGALLGTQGAAAHCDSLDGPVVSDARTALEQKDVTPVLKWLMPEHEEEIRSVFAQTRKVRTMGAEARELADRYFFETLVRLHREGEGAPYTGLEPAGLIQGPVQEADHALAEGSVEGLAQALSAHIEQELRERFARTLAARKRAGESVAAGREFVGAYVEYVHFVEGIAGMVHGRNGH